LKDPLSLKEFGKRSFNTSQHGVRESLQSLHFSKHIFTVEVQKLLELSG